MKELKTKAEVAEAILEETVVDRKGSKPTYDLMFDCGCGQQHVFYASLHLAGALPVKFFFLCREEAIITLVRVKGLFRKTVEEEWFCQYEIFKEAIEENTNLSMPALSDRLSAAQGEFSALLLQRECNFMMGTALGFWEEIGQLDRPPVNSLLSLLTWQIAASNAWHKELPLDGFCDFCIESAGTFLFPFWHLQIHGGSLPSVYEKRWNEMLQDSSLRDTLSRLAIDVRTVVTDLSAAKAGFPKLYMQIHTFLVHELFPDQVVPSDVKDKAHECAAKLIKRVFSWAKHDSNFPGIGAREWTMDQLDAAIRSGELKMEDIV